MVNWLLAASRGAQGSLISCSHILSFTVQGNSAATAVAAASEVSISELSPLGPTFRDERRRERLLPAVLKLVTLLVGTLGVSMLLEMD